MTVAFSEKAFKNTENDLEADRVVVSEEDARNFIKRCLGKTGVDSSHADALADVLVTGDYRGHFSHGLNRLGTRKRGK
jgi:LDH2 family malate/lactate/ureidoglycolate dehydrogenase